MSGTQINVLCSTKLYWKQLTAGSNIEASVCQLTISCKLAGPNIVNLDPQFLQTMQVGGAPTQKLAESQLSITCKLAGPQHSEIGSSISTDNASWGNEPNIVKSDFQFLQTMQVGETGPT